MLSRNLLDGFHFPHPSFFRSFSQNCLIISRELGQTRTDSIHFASLENELQPTPQSNGSRKIQTQNSQLKIPIHPITTKNIFSTSEDLFHRFMFFYDPIHQPEGKKTLQKLRMGVKLKQNKFNCKARTKCHTHPITRLLLFQYLTQHKKQGG
jgi:hypothetical protein